MKRLLLLCLFVTLSFFSTSSAQSRDAYFGVGGSFFFLVPLLSIQAGGAVSDAIELRANLDTLIAANLLGGDVLYTLFPDPSVKVYLGAGPDFIFFPGLGGGFDFHATAGVEYRTGEGFGPVGIYGEVKPFLRTTFAVGFPIFVLRGGVNFHF